LTVQQTDVARATVSSSHLPEAPSGAGRACADKSVNRVRRAAAVKPMIAAPITANACRHVSDGTAIAVTPRMA